MLQMTFDSVELPLDSSTPLRKKWHFNHLYEDTQRRDFRPLEDKICLKDLTSLLIILILFPHFSPHCLVIRVKSS
jgi:hypothetical protein